MCRPSSAMDQEEFDIFVTRGLALWLEIISDWVTHAADLHIIFYEVISACNIPIFANNYRNYAEFESEYNGGDEAAAAAPITAG